MISSKPAAIIAAALVAAGLTLALSTGPSVACAAVVHVSLWDKGPESATADEAHPMQMGSGADMKMAMLGAKTDVRTVKAGTVTFDVSNISKDIVHEMILAPVPTDGVMPYLANDYKVDEEAAIHLGEVSELAPGQTGKLTVDLTPGKYVLFCNIPGHFIGGMWTEITVTQ